MCYDTMWYDTSMDDGETTVMCYLTMGMWRGGTQSELHFTIEFCTAAGDNHHTDNVDNSTNKLA